MAGLGGVGSPPAGAGASSDWPSFTLDLGNSRYPTQSAVTAANVALLHQRWYVPTPAPVTGTPVVLDGTVYVADWDGNVDAIDATSGGVKWTATVGVPISSSLAVDGGLVYVSVSPYDPAKLGFPGTQGVVALSQADGHVVWRAALPGTMHGVWASPTVYNGIVYIGAAIGIGQPDETDPSDRGEVYALDAQTGSLLWSTVLAGTQGGAGVWGSIVVDPTRNEIYFGTGNSFANNQGTVGDAYSMVALDASSGTERWHYTVYTNLPSGKDRDFGSTPNLFTFTYRGLTHSGVGMSNKNGKYYVVDRDTGRLVEKLSLGKGGIGLAGFDPSQTVSPTLYVPTYQNLTNPTCCGTVVAVSPADGKMRWRARLNGSAVGSVALIPGAVLVGDSKGNLYALSMSSGARLEQLAFPAPIYGGVSVAEGMVFVPTGQAFGKAAPTGVYAYSP